MLKVIEIRMILDESIIESEHLDGFEETTESSRSDSRTSCLFACEFLDHDDGEHQTASIHVGSIDTDNQSIDTRHTGNNLLTTTFFL